MAVLIDSSISGKWLIEMQWVSEWIRQADWSIEGLNSPCTIIWYVLKGTKTIQLGDKVYTLSSGDLVVMPPHVLISVFAETKNTETLHHLAIGLTAKIGVLDFVNVYRFPKLSKIVDEASQILLVNIWRQLVTESELLVEAMAATTAAGTCPVPGLPVDVELNTYYWDEALKMIHFKGLVYLLLDKLVQLLHGQLFLSTKAMDVRVHEACSFIQQHLGKKPSVAEIAQHVYLSESHLRLLFRQVLGLSPMEYLRLVRTERTRELLSMTRHNLKEISELLGFEDQSQLSRSFKEAEGIGPLEYRRRWQLL